MTAWPSKTTLQVGHRVGVAWIASTSTARPKYCQQQRKNLCDAGRFTGQHVDGGYAEAMIARADFVFPIPSNFDDVSAAPLLCAGVIGYRALKLAQVPQAGNLGIYGFGSSAHITLQLARHLGAVCYVITRGKAGKLAVTLGAEWAGGPDDTPPVALDSVIIFAPAGELVPRALQHVRKGGIVTCAGILRLQRYPRLPV